MEDFNRAQLLKSIAINIEEQGFKKLVVVSGHSGTAQHQALEMFSKEKIGNLKIFVFPGRNFPGGIDHAGKIETGLMLKIKSDLVHMHKIKKPYNKEVRAGDSIVYKKDGERRFKLIVEEIKKQILE